MANINARAIRTKKGLSQSEFWNRIGVTQSAGSRYEGGRRIPEPTKQLLLIAHGTEKQSSAVLKQLRGA